MYAGGTELLLAMKEGLVQYERLINVKNIRGLNEVTSENGSIHIGALCTHHQLETSPLLHENLPALVKLEQNVANVRVRQVGTLVMRDWRRIVLASMLCTARRQTAASAKVATRYSNISAARGGRGSGRGARSILPEPESLALVQEES